MRRPRVLSVGTRNSRYPTSTPVFVPLCSTFIMTTLTVKPPFHPKNGGRQVDFCRRCPTLLSNWICFDSILKFFQVDSTGMFRMTSSARYFKKGVGSSRPNWRWIMCFLERPKANTSCTAWVKRFSFS